VRSYACQDDAFPADTTVNQFFTESQFESYRGLGEETIAGLAAGDGSLGSFFCAAHAALNAVDDTGTAKVGEPCRAPVS